MKRAIKYFGKQEELKQKLLTINPYYNDYFIVHSALDNLVEFNGLRDEEYYEICDGLGNGLYNEGNLRLEKVLVDFLIENNLTIATAESCTGGMIASKIVDVSGASKVFYEGVVTYSNQSKIERLSVDEKKIEFYGAVSEQVAKEMAYGLLNENVDIGISTTGIAGPDGGSEEKPVGLVYVGIAFKECEPIAIECRFNGNRNEIRQCATNSALYYAYDYLNNNL